MSASLCAGWHRSVHREDLIKAKLFQLERRATLCKEFSERVSYLNYTQALDAVGKDQSTSTATSYNYSILTFVLNFAFTNRLHPPPTQKGRRIDTVTIVLDFEGMTFDKAMYGPGLELTRMVRGARSPLLVDVLLYSVANKGD